MKIASTVFACIFFGVSCTYGQAEKKWGNNSSTIEKALEYIYRSKELKSGILRLVPNDLKSDNLILTVYDSLIYLDTSPFCELAAKKSQEKRTEIDFNWDFICTSLQQNKNLPPEAINISNLQKSADSFFIVYFSFPKNNILLAEIFKINAGENEYLYRYKLTGKSYKILFLFSGQYDKVIKHISHILINN